MNRTAVLARGERALLAARELRHLPVNQVRRETAVLLEHAVGEPAPDDLTTSEVRRFERLTWRRAAGEPLPYIRGFAELRGLRVEVGPGVYPPSEHTDELVARAVRIVARRRRPVAVDVGTGCGVVALAIKAAVPSATVFGTDISETAVSLARRNARRLKLSVRFLESDLLSSLPRPLEGRIDLVAAHVPYVPLEAMRSFRSVIKIGVPREALTDGSRTGLELIGRLADESRRWLRPGGWLLLQGPSMVARSVAARLRRARLAEVQTETVAHLRWRDGTSNALAVVAGRAPRRM